MRRVLVLTERGSEREGRRRRVLAVLAALGALLGSWGVGQVLASDPIAYGVPFWPFADSTDRAEHRLMSEFARTHQVGAGMEVVQRSEEHGDVFLTLRLRLDGDQTRCREALIPGTESQEVSSRRVDC